MNPVFAVGNHIFAQADLTTPDAPALLREYPCAFTYTDPPWGPGWLRGYATKAGLVPSTDYPDFLRALADLARPTNHAFVEMGAKWQGDLVTAFVDSCATAQFVCPITYGSGKPALLTRFAWGDDAATILPPPDGMNDAYAPGWIMGRMPAGRVFDPCVGLGATPHMAALNNRPSLNLELNPARLERAMVRIEQATGLVRCEL